jgi:hypothetical protein
MLSVDEIEVIADSLSPAMRHALLRCSDASFGEEFAPRCWWDVVHGYRHATFRGTISALERRALVEVDRAPSMVRLTREGLRVQAALRLRNVC